MTNDLILIALPDEAPSLEGCRGVKFTGLGKINAASNAARLIERVKPTKVFNFGTAGGITVGPGLYKCTRFIERDMIISDMGLIHHHVLGPIVIGEGGLTLSTGDNFVTDPSTITDADLVDMEGYAIAKICKDLDIEFHCYKYVSDYADINANEHWLTNVHMGQDHYKRVLAEFGNNLL